MRGLFNIVLVVVLGLLTMSAGAGELLQHRVTAGLELDVGMSDADSVMGGYITYELDLPDPVSIAVEISRVTGDFDVAAGSGEFSSIGIAAAMLIHVPFGRWEPYVGLGGAQHFNDFDNVDYNDKVSMFWFGGTKFSINERFRADVSVRRRTLRPDVVGSDDGEINLDSWVLRAGLVVEL